MNMHTRFNEGDHDWVRTVQGRLTEIGLTDQSIRSLLIPVEKYLHDTGESAHEAYGMPIVWATQQVNALATRGELELDDLDEEHWDHWLGHGCITLLIASGAVLVFQAGWGLPIVTAVALLISVAASAFGRWGAYRLSPRNIYWGVFVDAIGSLPLIALLAGAVLAGDRLGGYAEKLSGAIHPEWSGVVPSWLWLLIVVLGCAVTSCRRKGQFLSSIRKNRGSDDALTPAGAGKTAATDSAGGEVSDQDWSGRFNRLGFHRWNLMPGTLAHILSELCAEADGQGLCRTHGTPRQVLTWVAPTYREPNATLPGVGRLAIALVATSAAIAQLLAGSTIGDVAVILAVAIAFLAIGFRDVGRIKKYLAQAKYNNETALRDTEAPLLAFREYSLGNDEAGQWGNEAQKHLRLRWDDAHRVVSEIVSDCRKRELDPGEVYGDPESWARAYAAKPPHQHNGDMT